MQDNHAIFSPIAQKIVHGLQCVKPLASEGPNGCPNFGNKL